MAGPGSGLAAAWAPGLAAAWALGLDGHEAGVQPCLCCPRPRCLQESTKTKHPQLLYESKIYKILQGGSESLAAAVDLLLCSQLLGGLLVWSAACCLASLLLLRLLLLSSAVE